MEIYRSRSVDMGDKLRLFEKEVEASIEEAGGKALSSDKFKDLKKKSKAILESAFIYADQIQAGVMISSLMDRIVEKNSSVESIAGRTQSAVEQQLEKAKAFEEELAPLRELVRNTQLNAANITPAVHQTTSSEGIEGDLARLKELVESNLDRFALVKAAREIIDKYKAQHHNKKLPNKYVKQMHAVLGPWALQEPSLPKVAKIKFSSSIEFAPPSYREHLENEIKEFGKEVEKGVSNAQQLQVLQSKADAIVDPIYDPEIKLITRRQVQFILNSLLFEAPSLASPEVGKWIEVSNAVVNLIKEYIDRAAGIPISKEGTDAILKKAQSLLSRVPTEIEDNVYFNLIGQLGRIGMASELKQP